MIQYGTIMAARTKKLLSAKDAALKAKEYYGELSEDYNRVELEEIELSDDKQCWIVTLGIYASISTAYMISKGVGERVSYKIFKIDSLSGDVLSMKIRPFPKNES